MIKIASPELRAKVEQYICRSLDYEIDYLQTVTAEYDAGWPIAWQVEINGDIYFIVVNWKGKTSFQWLTIPDFNSFDFAEIGDLKPKHGYDDNPFN